MCTTEHFRSPPVWCQEQARPGNSGTTQPWDTTEEHVLGKTYHRVDVVEEDFIHPKVLEERAK